MSEQEWLDMFSRNLVSLMFECGMSQSELAYESGLSKAAISKYVNRERMPKPTAILNIAYALRCDVSELIDFGEMVEW